MTKLVGVDIGGTHTDLALIDETTKRLTIAKVPTTSDLQSTGLLIGIDELGIGCEEIDRLVHGTTVATNALIERKGAFCGVIMTGGFRDALELRRRDRPRTYGLTGEFRPLIERSLRREVDERTTSEGQILTPVNITQVEEAGRQLLDAGVEVIVVSFLHSYANPKNERLAGEALRKFWPNEYIVLGSDICPAVREFERTSTAVISGYIQPVISRYLKDLVQKLAQRHYKHDVLIVQSNGGQMSARVASRLAANTILSGPAGGVTASAAIASEMAISNIVSCDMGGTSFDMCVIKGGRPAMTQQKVIDFGLPLCLPMLDVDALAAGGGSLARLDASGILTIGPESAGSNPGPVCYGRGGTIPTITDANFALGILNPALVIGKSHGIAINAESARAAIKKYVGDPLGLDVDEAAEAILRVAGTTMAGYLRRRLIEKGLDPRAYSLIAFGGAGPLHANRLMREVGFERAIIPYYPGIVSAMGCTLGQLRHDFVQTLNMRLSAFNADVVSATFEQLKSSGLALMSSEGVAEKDVVITFGADMCYRGQTHVMSVELPRAEKWDSKSIRAAFEKTYHDRYSQLLPDVDVVIINARMQLAKIEAKPTIASFVKLPTGAIPEPRYRKVYFGNVWRDCAIYDRLSLPVGAEIDGPAILEQTDTTTFVEPGYNAVVHTTGNIIIGARG